MAVFDHPDFEHREVAFLCDARCGLRAIVAVHHIGTLGTSGGGCRIWPYPSEGEALTDVLRLSRAMSFKLALLEIPAGGAKCVVVADPKKDKSPALLEALGRAVEHMSGRYVLGEDVGTTAADLEIIGRRTKYVMRGASSSGATAHGVLACMRESLRRALGDGELSGRRVAVQGLGSVGYRLCELLAGAGATLVVADLDDERVDHAVHELGARRESPGSIHASDVDVFAPCALGSVLDEHTIPELRCRVIAGSANNQLASDACADLLAARGVLFAPDFIVNAGGVLGAARSIGTAADEQLEERLAGLLRAIYERADREQATPYAAAVAAARERLRG